MSFFDHLSPFCFLLIEFHCTFSISYKNYNILFNIIIIFWFGCDRPSGLLFFRACLVSFYTHTSLLTFFVCFCISFRSCCSHALVFGKTLVHEFPISYSHTEWSTCHFPTVQLQVHNMYSERKTRNSCALVNLCL